MPRLVSLPCSSERRGAVEVPNGGTDSSRLVAVMVSINGTRVFTVHLLRATSMGSKRAARSDSRLRGALYDDGTSVYPNEGINPVRPSPNARGLSAVTRYGMATFSDCHLPRQRVALSAIASFVRKHDPSQSGGGRCVGRSLLIVLGRCVDRWSSCCRLDSTRDTVPAFRKQALQLVWDFCEANPFSGWSGGLANAVEWVESALEKARLTLPRPAQVHLGDACALPLPDRVLKSVHRSPLLRLCAICRFIGFLLLLDAKRTRLTPRFVTRLTNQTY